MRLCVLVMAAVLALVMSKVVPENKENPDLLLLEDIIAITNSFQHSSKGLQYYLHHYGSMTKTLLTYFMDSYGVARSMQLAVPALVKLLLLVVYAAMQFQPSLLAFQETAQTAYIFLQHFNSPELKMMNDLTDSVFEILDNKVV